ncbi:MAG TPA: peptidoglycan-associated lipoprotein Pal [Candidatus Deferrimicrobiaceae bacterium]
MRVKWFTLLLVLLLAASVGCTSKKQTVRGGAGDSGAGGGATGGQAGIGGAGGQGGEGAISSETVRSEGGLAGGRGGKGGTGAGGDGRLAAAEALAGVNATQEKASPFQDIRFDFDQSTIREDARPILAGIAAYMAKNSGAQLIIEGHCDSRGTAEYNMALGERRAEAARKYLSALGVKSSALQTVSYGKEKPFMQGETEEAWAMNRRGHFLVR